jgi:uncharacterized protein
MIVEFSVGNFRSIKDVETLSMVASPKVSANKELDVKNVHRVSDKLTLLKSKAIYGANASGKSNMVKAINAFKVIVTDSVKDEEVLGKSIRHFELKSDAFIQPTFFQMVFILNSIEYRYGFETWNRRIISEWLFGKPGKKEVPYFVREEKKVDVSATHFKGGQGLIELFGGANNEITRDNALFLTAAKTIGVGVGKDIADFISNIEVISSLSSISLHQKSEEAIREEKSKNRVLALLQRADIGIDDIQLRETEYEGKKYKYTVTSKKMYDDKGNPEGTTQLWLLSDESEGSKRMFELGPEIVECLRSGRPLIIDEFDARFHPELTKRLVELMNSHANKKGQVIFVTHDTNLLDSDLLRRDQICLVEKDKYGASHFYTLADFKGVLSNAKFEKDYLAGRYGAIPLLGDFESLLED